MIVEVSVQVLTDDRSQVAATSSAGTMIVQVPDVEQNTLRAKAAVRRMSEQAARAVVEQLEAVRKATADGDY